MRHVRTYMRHKLPHILLFFLSHVTDFPFPCSLFLLDAQCKYLCIWTLYCPCCTELICNKTAGRKAKSYLKKEKGGQLPAGFSPVQHISGKCWRVGAALCSSARTGLHILQTADSLTRAMASYNFTVVSITYIYIYTEKENIYIVQSHSFENHSHVTVLWHLHLFFNCVSTLSIAGVT